MSCSGCAESYALSILLLREEMWLETDFAVSVDSLVAVPGRESLLSLIVSSMLRNLELLG